MNIRNSVAYSRTHATSLLKGMRLLTLFTRERPEWGVGEMSVALGSAKSTASRIARTLESEGFLVRSRNSPRYRLGLTLWELGCQAVGENMEFPRHAHPYLEEIVTSVNESAHAVILDDGEALHVEKVDAGRSIQTFTTLGARYPVHCTATGKSMLAFQSEERIEAVLSSQLARYTERTITDSAKLRQNLAQARARGFAMAKGEWRLDIGGIAAPVRDRTGNVFGALGVTMPLIRYPKKVLSRVADVLLCATEHLSREFGFVPESDPTATRPRSRVSEP